MSVYGPNVSVEVAVVLACEAVSMLGLELEALAVMVTLPELCPDSVIVDDSVVL